MNTARVHPIIHLAWLKSTCKFYSMRSKPSSSWLSRYCVTKLKLLCGYSSFQGFIELVSTVYTWALYLFPIMWAARLINYLWPTYVHFPVLIPTSIVVVLQFLLSVDLVLCTCTKQALFLVMSLWPISQLLNQLQLLQYSKLYYLHECTKQVLFLFPYHVALAYEVQRCFQIEFLNTSISKCSWLVRSHLVWYRTNGLGKKLLISSSLSKINLFFLKT